MVTTNEEIRRAAETLVRSSSSYQNPMPGYISHSHSLTTTPSIQAEYVMAENVIGGRSVQGKMSNVRRFFCLFVTFDLAFIGLMWLICTMINGESIHDAFEKQIYHYKISTSLFDIVLAAVFRFIALLLFYGLLSINHWIVIALSTSGTCALIIAKVFVYSWADSRQPVFDVLLILGSFVISWGEVWFLDFKVIPQELHAQQFFNANRESEREPLVRSYVDGLPDMYTESVGNFYSPIVSPEPSMQGGEHQRKYPAVTLTAQQESTYKTKAVKALDDSCKLLYSNEWKLEKKREFDTIFVMTKSAYGKIFKVSGPLDVAPSYLLEELFYNVENVTQWNTNVVESHKIQTIDEHTDITYQVAADAPGVSSRDFVNVRHWNIIDESYIIAYTAVEHTSVPKNDKKYIRGENPVGCWAMHSIPGRNDACQFEWLFSTNLKGWLPQSIVDQACKNVLFDFMKKLRKYVAQLKETGRLQ